MGSPRNDRREIVNNSNALYSKILEKRGRILIEQYLTKQITYPTQEQIQELFLKKHFWSMGDRYWKIAAENYSNPELWWVIAWFNKRPTEAHLRTGDLVYIPHPLDRVYSFFGV